MAEQDGIHIFISYGRKDATAFVDRLEKDLRLAGYAVFRDLTDLKAPHPWDEQLDEALKESEAVIAVLTPHAVRTGPDGDSVCLDELHAARFNKPPTPIVPVLLIPCRAPLIIRRLQQLNFDGTSADNDRYQRALGELLQTIRRLKEGKAIPDRMSDFEPLDFDFYLKHKTKDFVGRQWLAAEVLERISRLKSASTLLIVAEAGWGKTAFSGHLFASDPDDRILAAHFCREDWSDTTDPLRFVQNVCAMAALRIEAYEQRLRDIIASRHDLVANGNATELFERLFLEPLAALDSASLGKLPLFLLVDSLDEAASRQDGNNIPCLLARTSHLFPSWLKLVATTRDLAGIVDLLPDDVLRIDRHDSRNLADIRELIEQTISRSGKERAVIPLPNIAGPLVRAIAAKADGNTYYAVKLADAVRKTGMDIGAISQLPKEIIAFNRAMADRGFGPRSVPWEPAREILEMVLATPDALPIHLACRARGDESEYETRAVVEGLSDWVEVDQDRMGIQHALTKEFLELKSTPYFVNSAVGATRLAEFSTAQAAPTESLKRYFRKHEVGWILNSHNPSHFADRLRLVYDRRFAYWDEGNFRPAVAGGRVAVRLGGDSENFFLPVPGGGMIMRGLSPNDRQLLEAIAATSTPPLVTGLIDFSFDESKVRFDASYYPLRQDAYNEHYKQEPPKSDQNYRTMRTALNIAQFGLLMIRNLADIRPDWRSRLVETLARAEELLRMVGQIDGGLAGYLPPLDNWFVPVCDSICGYAHALEKKLTVEPGLSLLA